MARAKKRRGRYWALLELQDGGENTLCLVPDIRLWPLKGAKHELTPEGDRFTPPEGGLYARLRVRDFEKSLKLYRRMLKLYALSNGEGAGACVNALIIVRDDFEDPGDGKKAYAAAKYSLCPFFSPGGDKWTLVLKSPSIPGRVYESDIYGAESIDECFEEE